MKDILNPQLKPKKEKEKKLMHHPGKKIRIRILQIVKTISYGTWLMSAFQRMLFT